MNDPLVVQLIMKYSTIFIKEIVQIVGNLNTNKSVQEVIQTIQHSLIPRVKIMIVNREKETQQHKQELSKQLDIYKNIKLEKDEFSQEIIEALDSLHSILGNKNYQPLIIKNIQYIIDCLIGFCLELYYVMYPIISDEQYEENQFISGFDDLIKNIVDPDLTYQQIFQQVLGQHWYNYVQYEQKNKNIFNNKINFKNVSIKSKNEMIKKAELQLIIKWYTIFFDKYYTTFIQIGEKILPKNITRWLPISTDLLFGKPIVVDVVYNYLNSNAFKLTNICCSKEFIKLLMVCKKIFKQ